MKNNLLENIGSNLIPLNIQISELVPLGLFLGKGNQALEIAFFESFKKPTNSKVNEAFRTRKARRATPVLIVIQYTDGITLCGTSGDDPPIHNVSDFKQVERLCSIALEKPDRNSAIRFLSDTIPSLETSLPGIFNQGLLSSNELIHGTKVRADWTNAVDKTAKILNKSGKELITSLGFKTDRIDNLTELLTTNEENIALGVFLNENELPQLANNRFNNISPISYALTKADKLRLQWVLITQKDRIRLYSTKNLGVASRGRIETFIECQPLLLSSKNLGLLWLLFSSEALKDGGTLNSILENSKRFAADLADRLRERIYENVIPKLAMSISKVRNILNPQKDDLVLAYEMAVTVLFRLLFISYAEDRDFLPFKNNENYRKRSLKKKARELAKSVLEKNNFGLGDHHWRETEQLWNSISKGNGEWGIPAYGGAMFSDDKSISRAGYELSKISIPNDPFEEILCNLLLTDNDSLAYAPIDFRSLSVREFGTIYEGLLESELSIAEENLTIDKKGSFLPAQKKDQIVIKKGEIYLHDRSGVRKSTGSFFTKEFLVEYLLDRSLDPALDEHLERITKLDEAERTEQLFDFRVADIAMGSGHFLVAAIDRIEFRFALWLEENPTPGILRELQFMRGAAKKSLGELSETVVIEDSQLLRRMIARKCIYGVDLNPITVQLSQLSIWIHTFVPGLPLSLLDHNLIKGNSLVGVASLNEIYDKFQEGKGTLFEVNADYLLGEAAKPLMELAKMSDASIKDIEDARILMKEARQKTLTTQALCDLITAQPISNNAILKGYIFENWDLQKDDVLNSTALKISQDILSNINPVHFPVAFPEVFLGYSKGFNVILGNPPWEAIKVEEKKFWARYYPGIKSKSQREFEAEKVKLYSSRPDLLRLMNLEKNEQDQIRKIILAGNYPGIGKGDPDLYKAFSWRFVNLISQKNGSLGVVMPRSAISANGSQEFRRYISRNSESVDITLLRNSAKWVFDIHPQYTVALISITRKVNNFSGIFLKGPFISLDHFKDGINKKYLPVTIKEIESWTEDCVFPLLPNPESLDVLRQLKKSPCITTDIPNDWFVKPRRELDASLQKNLMDLESHECPEGFWPIYKGASFDIWNSDTKEYYAWGNPKIIKPFLLKRELNRAEREGRNSNFKNIHAENPRISFRLITRATDNRTMRVSLIPPKCFQQHSVQFLEFIRGDVYDQLFVLGFLSSIPLDWYSRKFVELNFTFNYFNSLPIPRLERSNPLWMDAIKLSGRLAFEDLRFDDWAKKLDIECGYLESFEKNDYICKLDAVVANIYGLNKNQVIHIYETFHHGWDFEPNLRKVIKYFEEYSPNS